MKILIKDFLTAQKNITQYTNIPIVASMNNYIQHRNVTTLQHCINVAIISIIIVKYFSLKVNENELPKGAILRYCWSGKKLKNNK